MSDQASIQATARKKACSNCGAELVYKPGSTEVICDYCSHTEAISVDENGFKELELYPYLKEMGSLKHSEEITMLHCNNCGADQHVEENYKSLHCVYCASPLLIKDAYQEAWILPGAVLPFQIEKKKSHVIFKKWVSNLWWAPNNLKKAAIDPQFTKGLYLPYWTFDAQLQANYSGQRGTYYYETQSYKDSNGRRQTRQVRKTRWFPVSGSVSGFVDDTLVAASAQRKGRVPKKIAHWDLEKLQPFNSSFLAGFVTEKYTIPLSKGHLSSKDEAKRIADRWSRRDIGGDTQRISSLDVKLTDETFKHILLPVYISSYKFNGKEYNFFVNGDSGAIHGTRPYSFWKIFFAIVIALLVVGAIVYATSAQKGA